MWDSITLPQSSQIINCEPLCKWLALQAEYAFKLSFLNRCDELERPIIEEYFQRSFGIDISDAKVANVKEWRYFRRI